MPDGKLVVEVRSWHGDELRSSDYWLVLPETCHELVTFVNSSEGEPLTPLSDDLIQRLAEAKQQIPAADGMSLESLPGGLRLDVAALVVASLGDRLDAAIEFDTQLR